MFEEMTLKPAETSPLQQDEVTDLTNALHNPPGGSIGETDAGLAPKNVSTIVAGDKGLRTVHMLNPPREEILTLQRTCLTSAGAKLLQESTEAIAAVNTAPAATFTGSNRASGESTIPAADKLFSFASLTQTMEALACFRQHRFPISQIRCAGGRLVLKDHSIKIPSGGSGPKRLCKEFGIPHDYYRRLPLKLQTDLLDHHCRERYTHQADGVADAHSVIIERDNQFVAFGRADLLTLTPGDVSRAIREGVGSDVHGLKVTNFRTGDESFALDLVSPRKSGEAKPGDVLYGGIHLDHSFIGEFPTVIMSFIYRLKCANGLTHREPLRTRRLPSDGDNAGDHQFQQICRHFRQTWAGLDKKLAGIFALQEEKFSTHGFEKILAQARLYSRPMISEILQAWDEESDLGETAFRALNALTRVGTHSTTLSLLQRQTLSRLAGDFAYQHHKICPECYSVLRA